MQLLFLKRKNFKPNMTASELIEQALNDTVHIPYKNVLEELKTLAKDYMFLNFSYGCRLLSFKDQGAVNNTFNKGCNELITSGSGYSKIIADYSIKEKKVITDNQIRAVIDFISKELRIKLTGFGKNPQRTIAQALLILQAWPKLLEDKKFNEHIVKYLKTCNAYMGYKDMKGYLQDIGCDSDPKLINVDKKTNSCIVICSKEMSRLISRAQQRYNAFREQQLYKNNSPANINNKKTQKISPSAPAMQYPPNMQQQDNYGNNKSSVVELRVEKPLLQNPEEEIPGQIGGGNFFYDGRSKENQYVEPKNEEEPIAYTYTL